MTETAIVRLPSRPSSLPLSGASRTDVLRYHDTLLAGCAFPLVAGAILYGWRAVVALVLVTGSALAATFVWRRVGVGGRSLSYAHIAWSAMVLTLLLPAHLAGRPPVAGIESPLWVLPAAGIVLAMLVWLLGGLGAGRVPPVVVTYLLLWALFAPAMTNGRILQRDRMLHGDLLSAPRPPSTPPAFSVGPWIQTPPPGWSADAQWVASAATNLEQFTAPPSAEAEPLTSLGLFLRDRLPPLEDLIVAGQPTAIGLGSAVAVIVGGLYLVYRGVLDHRIPIVIILAAYLAMLVLPLPLPGGDGTRYRWLPILQEGVTAEAAITFIHYQLHASPLLFFAVFVATATPLRPVGRTARLVYAATIGVLSAAAQYYLSIHWGPAAAMIAVCLLTPYLDKWSRPRTLV